MANKAYWQTLADIMEFTGQLTGEKDEEVQKDIAAARKKAESAEDKPMEEITLAGLAKEFFEVAGETLENYRNAQSEEERSAILKEIRDVGSDIFSTIADEAKEVSASVKSRLAEMEEENDSFLEEMEEQLQQRMRAAENKLQEQMAPVLCSTDVKNAKQEWRYGQPVLGDHVRVKRLDGIYCHHGVYVGNNTVIHFAPPSGNEIINWQNAEVIETELEEFLKGGRCEVRQYSDAERLELFSPAQIVKNAEHCLGFQNYNLIFNNCEHFATSCTTGKHRSQQVQDVFNTIFD